MKKYCLLLCGLCIAFLSHAQMDSAMGYDADKSVQFYFGLGAAFNNYKNLNNTLENNSLPTVGKFGAANSVSLDLRHKNFLIGLNGNMSVSYKRPSDYNVMLINYSPDIHVGYYVANSKKFHFAPQVGIGLYSSNVTITQRKNISNFNDVLTNGNSININQNTGVLDFCLRFDFADFTKARSKAASIKLGYNYGLSKRGWGIDVNSNSTVDNSPEDRINQLYVMFSLGASLLKPQHMK